ncbi:MAG TPA: hypothetical protein VMT54_01975 [Candidatus Cybelea sp.]|nr:hypothetical protein [Candidatus Cybelea sp.]
MDRDRKNNRAPMGLSFLMWPALVRAPWLVDTFFTGNSEDRRREERRRRRDPRW